MLNHNGSAAAAVLRKFQAQTVNRYYVILVSGMNGGMDGGSVDRVDKTALIIIIP